MLVVRQLVEALQRDPQLGALGFTGEVKRLRRRMQKLVGQAARELVENLLCGHAAGQQPPSKLLRRIGHALAADVTTMSKPARRSDSSLSVIALAPKRAASCAPRSSVRLATVIERGLLAAKCVAESSIISPTPMNSTRCSEI